jgi:hypothetical protein
MKYIALILIALVSGCTTFNATVDGAQHIVNKTIEATGEGVANVTSAIGEDVTDTITYGVDGVANGIRAVTKTEE